MRCNKAFPCDHSPTNPAYFCWSWSRGSTEHIYNPHTVQGWSWLWYPTARTFTGITLKRGKPIPPPAREDGALNPVPKPASQHSQGAMVLLMSDKGVHAEIQPACPTQTHPSSPQSLTNNPPVRPKPGTRPRGWI